MKYIEVIKTLFHRKEIIQAIFLFMLMFLGAVLEVAGIGMIMPFISVINDPEYAKNSNILMTIYSYFNIHSYKHEILLVGAALIIFYVIKSTYLTFMYYVQTFFVYKSQERLTNSLYKIYINSPYTMHLSRNSSNILKNLTSEMNALFNGIYVPALTIATEIMVVILIASLLIYIEPYSAISALVVLTLTALGFWKLVKNKTSKMGDLRQREYEKLIKSINQSLGCIKEIKIGNKEGYFFSEFGQICNRYCRSTRYNAFLAQMPRVFIEAVVIITLLLTILIIVIKVSDIKFLIPTFSLFALAAMRLIPSFSRIINSVNSLLYFTPGIKGIYDDLKNLAYVANEKPYEKYPAKIKKDEFTFKESLEIKDLIFRYPNTISDTLRSITLKIPINSSIGIVGPSGAGKSTIVDVILGLLPPDKGTIKIDEFNVYENLTAWRKKVGYVPQSIYLIDDSIKNNIALGIPDREISEEQLKKVLHYAQLDDFVGSLQDGVNTIVGEVGVRLSGGQRQRIGIARALYHNPEVIIFDEATSSLDNKTESEVTAALERLSGKKTMIIIAHRLKTVEKCDSLYFINNGENIASGSYAELIATNQDFRKMVGDTLT